MPPINNLPNNSGNNPDCTNPQAGRWKPWLKRAGRVFDLVSWIGKGWPYLFNEDDGLLAPLREFAMTLMGM